jgi:YggT family protein
MVLAIDTISAVQNFVWAFTGVYVLAILAYIITSWVNLPYSLRPVQRFLYDLCEPYLRFWRRILPFSTGPIDFSPILAIAALALVSRIVISLLERLH